MYYRLKWEFTNLLILGGMLCLFGCTPLSGKENLQQLAFSYTPGSNDTRVPINTVIQITFLSLLEPASVQPGLFLFQDAAGNTIPVTITYTPYPESSYSTVTLTPVSYSQSPPAYLQINANYSVTIGYGIKSVGGDAVSPLTTWTFATSSYSDFTPPVFGGVISAQSVDMGSVKLTWGPAVDNPGGTPVNQLAFEICVAKVSGTCGYRFTTNFPNPAARIDSNGNYNFVVKPLAPETKYYFVVRVQDLAGNQDSNTVEVSATTRSGRLYVANFNNNEVLRIDEPSRLLTTSELRSIKASKNGLADPYGVYYDQPNDRLFIAVCKTNSHQSFIDSVVPVTCEASTSTIAVYNQVSRASAIPGGDLSPDWVLYNNAKIGTDIRSGLNGPTGIYLDSSSGHDTLYVANFAGGSVTIYDNVTAACQAYISANSSGNLCNVTPRANFTSYELTMPFGITFDPAHHLLYVSNFIASYPSTDASGNAIPLVPGYSIAVFDDTNGASGRLTGTHPGNILHASNLIGGLNDVSFPAGLAFDPNSDTLYIANQGNTLGAALPDGSSIYPGIIAVCNVSLMAPVLSGTPPAPVLQSLPPLSVCSTAGVGPNPGRQDLAGDKTGLILPAGIALSYAASSSTPSLYISDYLNNAIFAFSPNPLFGISSANFSTPAYNSPPSEVIAGQYGTELKKPVGIGVGTDAGGNDSLYLASLGWDEIVFFDQPAQYYSSCPLVQTLYFCTFPASRKITSSISGPAGIYLDNSVDSSGIERDRLYVSNFSNNSIVILEPASAIPGGGNAFAYLTRTVISSKLKNPFGIYVDTSQSRQWVYVVNSRVDETGNFAVLVFDLSLCPPVGTLCNFDLIPGQPRTIYSPDFNNPAGIWVDETVGANNEPRDMLYLSNRAGSTPAQPGYIAMFSQASTLAGTVPATKLIGGNQTSLLTPAGLFMDSPNDTLYIAEQGYNEVLAFNQPEICTVTQGNQCNIPPNRSIYNTLDISHAMDGPSSVTIDFSHDQLYVSNLGLYDQLPSILSFAQASTANNIVSPTDYLFETTATSTNFPLNYPESLALDPSR